MTEGARRATVVYTRRIEINLKDVVKAVSDYLVVKGMLEPGESVDWDGFRSQFWGKNRPEQWEGEKDLLRFQVPVNFVRVLDAPPRQILELVDEVKVQDEIEVSQHPPEK